MRRAGCNIQEGNKSSWSRQKDDTVRWGGREAIWGQPDTKLSSSPKGYYMNYACSGARWETDIWMTPLWIKDLQFHRLGSSSCPIAFLLDRNSSSRCVCETEPEIRALLWEASSSEGRSSWNTHLDWKHFQHVLEKWRWVSYNGKMSHHATTD